MIGINHDAPMIGVRSSTAKPNEHSGRRDAVDEPRKIVTALLMPMQWRRACDMVGRRACVGGVSVLRRYPARHKWWNCQSRPLMDSESIQHLARKAKPLVVKPAGSFDSKVQVVEVQG